MFCRSDTEGIFELPVKERYMSRLKLTLSLMHEMLISEDESNRASTNVETLGFLWMLSTSTLWKWILCVSPVLHVCAHAQGLFSRIFASRLLTNRTNIRSSAEVKRLWRGALFTVKIRSHFWLIHFTHRILSIYLSQDPQSIF